MRSEYDFSLMKGGVQGKYMKAYKKESNVVLLEPDVTKAFPNADSVNQVLRDLMKLARLRLSHSR